MTDPHAVRTEAQLREIIPEPEPGLARKLFDHLDPFAQEFVAKSPLLFVATYGPKSGIDVSPKGDAPGFVHVDSSRTLSIPERRGNRLAYGFRNLLRKPSIGLLFVVPGVTETLRVNGKAEIRKDPALLERLAGGGKPAILVTRVLVEECFFHCGKTFLRSTL
jgi:PPOX class probable FMN-dependent enzyme